MPHLALGKYPGSIIAIEFGFRVLDAQQPVGRIQDQLCEQIRAFLARQVTASV